MIFREKIEYAITGNVEYIINLLAKHNVAINRPIVKNDSCFVKISSKDCLSLGRQEIYSSIASKKQQKCLQ